MPFYARAKLGKRPHPMTTLKAVNISAVLLIVPISSTMDSKQFLQLVKRHSINER